MNLDGLNDCQKRAVKRTEGPLLIIAGAGSGKTRVLTNRIAYLIDDCGVAPYNILAITFTNKAAREMRERVDATVGQQAGEVWVSTFHSTCVRILRRYIDRIGYSNTFTIYDTDDVKSVIKDICKKFNIDTKMLKEKTIMNAISHAKDELMSPDQMELEAGGDYNGKRIANVYREYQKTLKLNNALDFDDLIYKTVELLENDAETRTSVAQIVSATPHYSRQEREKIIKSNLKAINHPYFSRYTPLQKLCLRILRHERIKYGLKEDKIYGILFDVSYLWEEYLATILTKQRFEHPNNKKGKGRIYLAKQNRFPRYPDFYREYDGVIIDAKYKTEIDKRDDVNQILTYMYRLKGKYGIFIQPSNGEYRKKTYDLLGYGAENDAKLQAYLYPIPQNVSDYKRFVEKIMESENLLSMQFQPQ